MSFLVRTAKESREAISGSGNEMQRSVISRIVKVIGKRKMITDQIYLLDFIINLQLWMVFM